MEIKVKARGMAVANKNKVNEKELEKYLTKRGIETVKKMRKEKQHSAYLKYCV